MEFIRIVQKERCLTESSDTSIYDVTFKAREVQRLIYQLDKVAGVCKPGSFSFGHLPQKHQMPLEIFLILQEIKKSPFFMFHAYFFSRLQEDLERDSHHSQFYIREFCKMEEYLKKTICFYEWCGNQE
jgi:hypothetical protein